MGRRGWLVFAAVGILWGSAWIAAPILPMPELAAGAARFAFAAAMLGTIAVIFRVRQSRAAFIVPSLVLGVTLIGLPYALAVWAKDTVSAGVVAVVYATTPLAAHFFGQDSSPTTIPALAIGMGGVAFLVAQGLEYSLGQIKGAALLILAVVLAGFSLNYAKRHIRKGTILFSSAIQCAVASVLLLVLSVVCRQLHFASWNWTSVSALGGVAVAESVVALPLLYWLLSEIEPWEAGMLQWVSTLVAVAEAAWFLRARPTMQMVMGAAVILGAIFWLMRQGVASNFSGNSAD